MALDSYTGLQAAVADYLNRDDLTSEIVDFITLAEAEFNRTLFVPDREEESSATVSDGTVTLPSDFWALRSVFINADPKVVLQQMSMSELRSTYSAAATGQPLNFAMQSGNEMILGPSPDSDYTLIINYWQKIPPLASNSTNWLLTNHPDIYLYGALLQGQYLMLDEDRANLWRQRLSLALQQLQDSSNFKAYSATPVRIRSPYIV